jgi:ABC-type transport system involved in cytochrome c biogenesis permease subunit
LSLLALIGVYFKWITVVEFVYVTAGIYLAFIVTMLYAFISKPEFHFQFHNAKEIMVYIFLLFYQEVSLLTFGY